MPKKDCGACGYAGCEEYAKTVAQDSFSSPERQVPLHTEG
ncbi:MAG: (Fe-S)-binding protein [Actinomycetota bacterium]|nr:(Fe-S)-binding protein [Actinomycetota bacterium]